MMATDQKLALYMQGAFSEQTGKLGLGLLRYSQNPIVAMIDSENAGADSRPITGIDRVCPIVRTVTEAADLGAEVLVLGIAPPGGLVPQTWWPALDEAVFCGMSLVNGLHDKLAPRYPALKPPQYVWDVRTEPPGIGVGTAAARLLTNRRVLMVGTDMSVGKMTAALELTSVATARGLRAKFIATGQTGMIISGSGAPLDAIRLDYASGAIESAVLEHREAEIVFVEGQGSLLHPGSSATLPLMRGSCPTHLVLCHRAGMTHLAKVPWVRIPDLSDVARLFEDVSSALGTFPAAKVVGVALNTGHLPESVALDAVQETMKLTGLPTCDPVRQGASELLDAILD